MSSNAWDRAQRAITRAEERDARVVTPDNAVSPFDAAATTIIPTPDLPAARRGRHQRPDATEAAGDTSNPGTPGADGRRPPRLGARRHPPPHPGRVPVRRPHPADTSDGTDTTDGIETRTGHSLDEPPTVELASDAPTVDVAASPDVPPGSGSAPRPSGASPGTAPFAAADHDAAAGGGTDQTDRSDDEAPARRAWWKRLFGG